MLRAGKLNEEFCKGEGWNPLFNPDIAEDVLLLFKELFELFGFVNCDEKWVGDVIPFDELILFEI